MLGRWMKKFLLVRLKLFTRKKQYIYTKNNLRKYKPIKEITNLITKPKLNLLN